MKIDQEILELSIYLTLKLCLQKTNDDMIYQKEKFENFMMKKDISIQEMIISYKFDLRYYFLKKSYFQHFKYSSEIHFDLNA